MIQNEPKMDLELLDAIIQGELYTITEVAEFLHEPTTRVAYMARKHKIEPTRRAGTTQLFNYKAIAKIGDAINNMQIQKHGRGK